MSRTEPDFVKTADEHDRHGNTMLPPTAFADPLFRSRPIHTKAATWTSASLPNSEEVLSVIRKAAVFHGIAREVEELLMQKTAAVADDTDENFAMVIGTPTGRSCHFPLRNDTEIRKAAAYFIDHAGEFTFAERHMAAVNILKRAESADVELDDREQTTLTKLAGLGDCVRADAAGMLRSRAAMIGGQCGEQLNKLAASLPPRVDREARLKLANVLDELDRWSGLDRRYGQHCDRPEDVLFGITKQAVASALERHVQLTDGSVYAKTALLAVTEDSLREWLGDGVTDDVCDLTGVDHEKLAETLTVLPKDDARRFGGCAKACGLTPVA